MIAALERAPRELRVTSGNGTRAVLASPVLAGHTLVGRSPYGKREELRVPAGSIVLVESRGLDGAKTAALVGGTAMLVLVGIIAAKNAVETGLSGPLVE